MRYGNDVSKFFFAHHTSRKKKAVINLECARASWVDYEDVTLGAQLMPFMQYARPPVCDVAPLPALSGTEIDMFNQVHVLGMRWRSATRPRHAAAPDW